MKKKFLLLLFLIFSTSFSSLLLAQIESIQFKASEYRYILSDSSYNTTVWIDDGVEFHEKSGTIVFLIPFSPLERTTKLSLTHYLDNNSSAFFFKGFIDGDYDFSKNGTYEVIARGLMSISGSPIGKGYAVDIVFIVSNGVLNFNIKVPLFLKDYRFKTDLIAVDTLQDEIYVDISGKHWL
ncbi:MAG: hypothetical protein ACMZ7B_02155 [Balneola sp.]